MKASATAQAPIVAATSQLTSKPARTPTTLPAPRKPSSGLSSLLGGVLGEMSQLRRAVFPELRVTGALDFFDLGEEVVAALGEQSQAAAATDRAVRRRSRCEMCKKKRTGPQSSAPH